MKRSEMLKHVERLIIISSLRFYPFTDMEFAEHLLGGLEQVGMLPPQSKSMDFTKLGGTDVFVWEPEDE